MKCYRCKKEMKKLDDDNYVCEKCGVGSITLVTINGESFAKGEVWDKTTNVETDEGLQNKIADLEHQLAEKDKLIEELQLQNKELLDGAKQMLYESKEVMNNIRHQICEEIRNRIKQAELNYEWKGETISMEQILDQIEGENK